MLSRKTAVIQRVEPTKLLDLPIDNCPTTVASNIESAPSRYFLRNRDSNHSSAFYRPIVQNQATDEHFDIVSNDISNKVPSHLNKTDGCLPRRAFTPPLEGRNHHLPLFRSSTPPLRFQRFSLRGVLIS
jgi:hypothetical protein